MNSEYQKYRIFIYYFQISYYSHFRTLKPRNKFNYKLNYLIVLRLELEIEIKIINLIKLKEKRKVG